MHQIEYLLANLKHPKPSFTVGFMYKLFISVVKNNNLSWIFLCTHNHYQMNSGQNIVHDRDMFGLMWFAK
jgi:hypothetical protein